MIRARGFRRLRQRFGPAAPRLVVRPHVAWYYWGLCAVSAFLLGWFGRGLLESAELPDAVHKVVAPVLSGRMDGDDGLGAAAHRQLVRQLSGLERENAALREELFAYERLLAASGADGLLLEGLRLVSFSDAKLRYRFYLGARSRPLELKYRLAVNVQHWDGESVRHSPEVSLRLEANGLVRQESELLLRQGDVPKGAELSVYSGGKLLAKRVAGFEGGANVR